MSLARFTGSEAEYRALPHLSGSELEALARSPAHLLAARQNRGAATPAMNLGTAIHALILEGRAALDERFAFADIDRRTKAGKEAAEQAAQAGKILLDMDALAVVEGCAASIAADDLASRLLSGEKEVAIAGTCPETGAMIRGKIDCIGSAIVDLKTTANLEGWTPWRYMLQMAHYRHLAAGIRNSQHAIAFVVVETVAPYAVRIVAPDIQAIEEAERAHLRLLSLYAETVQVGTIPHRPCEIETVSAPVWELDRLARAGR